MLLIYCCLVPDTCVSFTASSHEEEWKVASCHLSDFENIFYFRGNSDHSVPLSQLEVLLKVP